MIHFLWELGRSLHAPSRGTGVNPAIVKLVLDEGEELRPKDLHSHELQLTYCEVTLSTTFAGAGCGRGLRICVVGQTQAYS